MLVRLHIASRGKVHLFAFKQFKTFNIYKKI